VSLVFFTLLGDAGSAAGYGHAFAETLPLVTVLYPVAAALVTRLPRGAQFATSLVERQPSWVHGLAYPALLSSGGRVGDHLFEQVLSGVTQRRHRPRRCRTRPGAPPSSGSRSTRSANGSGSARFRPTSTLR
jgi:hypothetical protein